MSVMSRYGLGRRDARQRDLPQVAGTGGLLLIAHEAAGKAARGRTAGTVRFVEYLMGSALVSPCEIPVTCLFR